MINPGARCAGLKLSFNLPRELEKMKSVLSLSSKKRRMWDDVKENNDATKTTVHKQKKRKISPLLSSKKGLACLAGWESGRDCTLFVWRVLNLA